MSKVPFMSKALRKRDLVANTDPGALPPSYTGLTIKEKSLLTIAKRFQAHFAKSCPRRRPLFLSPVNEAGVRKFVCTTIRPTLLPNTTLNDPRETALFVSQAVEYEPLAEPRIYPEVLVSPPTVMEWQHGDSFDMATLLASFLIGAGVDAYVVVGYSRSAVAQGDRSCEKTPDWVLRKNTQLLSRGLKRAQWQIPETKDLELDSWMIAAGLKEVDIVRTTQENVESIQHPEPLPSRALPDSSYLKLRSGVQDSKFDIAVAQAAKIPLDSYARDTLKIEALQNSRKVVSGVAPLTTTLTEVEETTVERDIKRPSDEALKLLLKQGMSEADEFAKGVLRNTQYMDKNYVYAWVYVNDESGYFLDPVSGVKLALDTPVYTGVELMFNDNNAYICQWPDENILPPDKVVWNTSDLNQWLPVLVTPEIRTAYGPIPIPPPPLSSASVTPFGLRPVLNPLTGGAGAVSKAVQASRQPPPVPQDTSWLATEALYVGTVEHWPVSIERTPLQLEDRYPERIEAPRLHDINEMLSDLAPPPEIEEIPEFAYDDTPLPPPPPPEKPPMVPLSYMSPKDAPHINYTFKDGYLTLISPYFTTPLTTQIYVTKPEKVAKCAIDKDGFPVFGHNIFQNIWSFTRTESFAGRKDGLLLRETLMEYECPEENELREDGIPFDWKTMGEEGDELATAPTRAFPMPKAIPGLKIMKCVYIFTQGQPVERYEYSETIQTAYFGPNPEDLKRMKLVRKTKCYVLIVSFKRGRIDALKRIRIQLVPKDKCVSLRLEDLMTTIDVDEQPVTDVISGGSGPGPRLWQLRTGGVTNEINVLCHESAPTDGMGDDVDKRQYKAIACDLIRLDEYFYPASVEIDAANEQIRSELIALGRKAASIPGGALEAFYPTDVEVPPEAEDSGDDSKSEMTSLTFKSARSGVKSDHTEPSAPDERYRALAARLDVILAKAAMIGADGSNAGKLVDRYRAQFPRAVGPLLGPNADACSGFKLPDMMAARSALINVLEGKQNPLLKFAQQESHALVKNARSILANAVAYTRITHANKAGALIVKSEDPASKRLFTRPDGLALKLNSTVGPDTTIEFHALLGRTDLGVNGAVDSCKRMARVRMIIETWEEKKQPDEPDAPNEIPMLARMRLRRMPPAPKKESDHRVRGVRRSILAPYLEGVTEPLSAVEARRVVQQANADLKQLLLNRVAVLQAHLSAAVEHLKTIKEEDGGVALRKVKLLKARIARSEEQSLARMKALMDEMEADFRLRAAFEAPK